MVIAHAAPQASERVLDVGCGTGNAAVLAAERGAQVTGVDPAERLLEVARAQAGARGLDIAFILGEAGSLPVADAAADVVVSVFGVIFASDASAAAAEMARVTAVGGRMALCAWVPDGAMSEVVKIRSQALAGAGGTSRAARPFAWHDRDALASLFAPHGFSVEVVEHALAFSAGTPEEFIDSEFRDHPMWVAGRDVLEPRGELQAVRDRAFQVLESANEDPSAFRITSRYIVATARRTKSA